MMRYFIHLYTDFLWNKYFISEIVEKGIIKNTKENKAYTFNLDNIKAFIDLSVKLINSVIKEL